jgi:DNA-binding transcriptional MocR family regulator
VVVTACAEEGIFLLYHALLRPGDHVIVETPCYEVGARGRAQHRR